MYDFTPRVREQRIANLTESMVVLHNLKATAGHNEGSKALYDAWRHVFQQREFYLVHAVCAHCWQVIDNRDYEGWRHEDGDEACSNTDEDNHAVPAVMPWRSSQVAA